MATWSSLRDRNLYELDWTLKRHADMVESFLPLTFVGNHDVTRVASQIPDRRLWSHAAALLLFLPFYGLVSLYVVSAMFGLFQGGIVPSYAIIVREHFPQEEAGARVGTVLMATLFGMALGGWMSGLVYDLTGNYQLAFLNGLAWNLVNIFVCVVLIRRERGPRVTEWKTA